MAKQAILRPQAQADVFEIGGYIAERSEEYALRFEAALNATLESLLETPEIGRLQPEVAPIEGMRSYGVRKFRNYTIYYRPAEFGIDVIRVLHGARDARRLFGDGILGD